MPPIWPGAALAPKSGIPQVPQVSMLGSTGAFHVMPERPKYVRGAAHSEHLGRGSCPPENPIPEKEAMFVCKGWPVRSSGILYVWYMFWNRRVVSKENNYGNKKQEKKKLIINGFI